MTFSTICGADRANRSEIEFSFQHGPLRLQAIHRTGAVAVHRAPPDLLPDPHRAIADSSARLCNLLARGVVVRG